jgi:hypothetical protein
MLQVNPVETLCALGIVNLLGDERGKHGGTFLTDGKVFPFRLIKDNIHPRQFTKSILADVWRPGPHRLVACHTYPYVSC